MHAYPDNLETLVRELWTEGISVSARLGAVQPSPEPPDPLPPSAVLRLLLSTCYQAGLMREEDRQVRFRVILREPGRFARDAGPPEGLHRLIFEQPLPLSANELRRLSPAAIFERTLIGLRLNLLGKLEIWGLVHSGAGWVQTLEGSRRSFTPLPSSLTIAASGPGRLTVARGSFTVVRLQGGRIVLPSKSVLESDRELPESKAARDELILAHEKARTQANQRWASVDKGFPRQLQQQLGLRIVSTLRNARHGGTILFLKRELARDREALSRYARLKYPLLTDESRQRARQLMLRTVNLLAEICGETHPPPGLVGWQEYTSATDPRLVAMDESMSEVARFVAGLAMVDGAVVMTHALEVIGFGAEISGELPDVEIVARVVDIESQAVEYEPATAMGTRHRSAYRLCKALPGSIALVVSQDASLRVITCLNQQVTCWEQLTAGVLDV